jgi:hypothetical protein
MKNIYLLVITLLSVFPVFSQWTTDINVNTLVANTSSDDQPYQLIKDGAGGSIVFFANGQDNVFAAQKITVSGTIAWGSTDAPVFLSIEPDAGYDVKAVPDGSGGAYLAWTSFPQATDSGDIIIQHISSAGVLLWGSNGININNTPLQDDEFPSLCTDGAGNIIVGWFTDNGINNIQMFAQRFNSAGTPQWAGTGVQICTAPGFRAGTLTSDGGSGAIAIFYDTRNDPHGLDYAYLSADSDENLLVNSDVFAQRINAGGQLQWTGSGVTICTAPGNQTLNQVVADGSGGAIVALYDARNSTLDENGDETNTDIYAQRVNANGVVVWAANGVPLATEAGNQDFAANFLADGTGGAVASYYLEGYTQTRLQRLSANGARSWGNEGLELATFPEGSLFTYSNTAFAVDGAGNTICGTYANYYTAEFEPTVTIKAQKLNAAGVAQWGQGVTYCNINTASVSLVTASTNGDAIFLWPDSRNEEAGADIYAAKILANGSLAGAAAASEYISATSGNWNTPATWVGGVVPPADAKVIVRHLVTVNVNISCYSLKVEQAAGQIKVNTGIVVNITH